MLLAQSEFARPICPEAHAGQVPPPQSMSVSVPFFTASAQLGDWHVPPEQTRLWQSAELPHIWPGAHAGQVPPPQSMSVSDPSLIPFTQLAPSVVLVVLVVVVVVVVMPISGAQRNFAPIGVTERTPNWSDQGTGASATFGHFSL